MQSRLADAELAKRIMDSGGAAPSEEAELCRRFWRRIRSYGLRHLRSEEAAADLAQRVLLVTLQSLRRNSVREPDRIASFVLGVARTLVKETHRRGQPEEQLSEDAQETVFAADRSVDLLASERLKGCMQILSERERSVVVLTYYGEQTSAEIATALALVEGNIRVIRYRAIGRLRDCMELKERL
jgi:RNA polymerase sigma factor (sigma-70 family)